MMHAPGAFSFRDALARDVPAIRSILEETFDAYGIRLPEDYSFADIEDIQTAYIETGGAYQVLTRADRLVGFFGLVSSGGRRVELKRLYLHPSVRGQGQGDRLIREAMRIAAHLGHTFMHLETTSRFREAVGLYRKYGFIDDADGHPSPGHDIAMMKAL